MVVGQVPPTANAMSFRALGLLEELPQQGWHPTVIAQTPLTKYPQDSSLAGAISAEIEVAYVPEMEVLHRITRLPGVARLLGGFGLALATPAVFQGLRLARRHRFDAVFGSANPFFCALAATVLGRLLDVPSVIEFRDPALMHERSPLHHRSPTQIPPGYRAVRRQVLKSADHVFALNQAVLDELVSEGGIDPVKTGVLTHGFRRSEQRPYRAPEADKMTLVYAGTLLFPHPSLRTFAQAVDQAVRAVPEMRQSLRVRFIGRTKHGTAAYLMDEVDRLNLNAIISYEPPMRHSDLQALLDNEASAQIVIGFDDLGRASPSKTYKAFGFHQPILGIGAPGGVLRQIIGRTRGGRFAGNNDVAQQRDILIEWFRQFEQGGLRYEPDEDRIQEYGYPAIAARLGSLLDNLINAQPGHARTSGM